MTRTRTRITRLVVAVVFALPVILSALSLSSLAAPSAEEVEAAKQKLAGLQHEFEVARRAVQRREVPTLPDRAEARRGAGAARGAERKARAPRDDSRSGPCRPTSGPDRRSTGSSAPRASREFSDRLEFMGAVAEGDAEIARQATNARQEAEWAAERFADTLAERQQQVAAIEGQLDRLDSMIDEQASLYEQLNKDRQEYLAVVAAQRAALAAGSAGSVPGRAARPTPRATPAATSRR